MALINMKGLSLLVSHKKIFKVFPIWVYVKQVTLGQCHNVNNLGKGPLNKTKYQMSKAKDF